MLSNQFSQFSPELTNSSQVRLPRAIVLINSIPVLWLDIKITTTTFYVADNYTVEIPLSGQLPNFTFDYLSNQSSLKVEIYIGFPRDPSAYNTQDLDLMMVGDCDEMTIDPLRNTAIFTGRDLTSRLIDTKTFSKYPNKKASTIVTELAEKHGLTPVVTPTSGNVGTFYLNENTLMTRETTEWDLVTFLAQQYNYVVYVEKTNLIFGPKPTENNSAPYILSYQPKSALSSSPIFNGMALDLVRSFTVAKDVSVKIRVPYSPLTGTAYTATAGKVNTVTARSNSQKQIYTYTIPGLTKEQALAKAQSLLTEITLNEMRLNCNLPGDNLLKKSSLIKLIGTNTKFDQIYYTDTVVRTLNYEDGYTMEVNAKNQDVSSQVIL